MNQRVLGTTLACLLLAAFGFGMARHNAEAQEAARPAAGPRVAIPAKVGASRDPVSGQPVTPAESFPPESLIAQPGAGADAVATAGQCWNTQKSELFDFDCTPSLGECAPGQPRSLRSVTLDPGFCPLNCATQGFRVEVTTCGPATSVYIVGRYANGDTWGVPGSLIGDCAPNQWQGGVCPFRYGNGDHPTGPPTSIDVIACGAAISRVEVETYCCTSGLCYIEPAADRAGQESR